MARGYTVWLTGLPCSGKTTLATALAGRLRESSCSVAQLDGDILRATLSKDLGFSREDREEHQRRIAAAARAHMDEGRVVVVSVVSPYRAIRERCRRELRRYVEVFVDCPLEECARRDVKGLYRKALDREIPHFTGVSDPYEPPLAPDVAVRTDRADVETCVALILAELRRLGYSDGVGVARRTPSR